MKKIFIAIVSIICAMSFVGCDTPTDSVTEKEKAQEEIFNSYFNYEIIAEKYEINQSCGEYLQIIVDKDTNVMYLRMSAYKKSAITPLLNADGTPKLYEEK